MQYFTGVSGQMFSFNYNNAEGLQLSNTDYTMCVRMERNFCGIQYTACPDAANTPPQAFSVTGGSPTLGSIVGTSVSINLEAKSVRFHMFVMIILIVFHLTFKENINFSLFSVYH